jgi:4a-hydroxytetrahydrobiopterin dehydratase
MELDYRKLSGDEIANGLINLPGWIVEGDKIAKTYEFDAYLAGAEFAGRVAHLAEELDHHPDIEIGYRKVRVSMNTHAVEGLSPYDLELAQRIESA